MDDEELELLREHATALGGDLWSFTGVPHTAEEALMIIRACLTLGTRVTDVITSDAWLKLVCKVADLENMANGSHGQRSIEWP